MGFRNFKGKKDVTSTKNNRFDTRYPMETDVLLIAPNYKGKFKTKDISQNGFALKQNVPKELMGKTIDYVIQYTSTSGQSIQTQGKAKLIGESLNRFHVTQGEIENFFSKIWPS
jgi:hypothetical protein